MHGVLNNLIMQQVNFSKESQTKYIAAQQNIAKVRTKK